MRLLLVKTGVQFTIISPGGFRILRALDVASKLLGYDITITSACDGEHSGPGDPHHLGRAYDIRCHDVPDKQHLWITVANLLADVDPGKFYSFIEDIDTPNEHIHIQVRHGLEITC